MPGRRRIGNAQRERRRALIIIQNLWIPLDRRVWQECQALLAAGIGVSVICPRGPGMRRVQTIDGVRTRTYLPPPPARGVLGYVLEFVWCWIATAWLAAWTWRAERFDVLQACNPPDTFFTLGWYFQKVHGVRFVYDQHDLCPELFDSRFGAASHRSLLPRALRAGLVLLERGTYRTADHVIATNESYRSVALRRGRRASEDVTIVRSGPHPDVMRPMDPCAELRHGAKHLLAYLGVMGPQDGVDRAIRAMDFIVHDLGRTDVHLTLMGKGDCLDELQALTGELGLDAYVDFTGRASDALVAEVCSTADLGLSPDPPSPLNDVSTMNKTMEYMAFGLPVVAFDLHETRVSAGEAAVYVARDDPSFYARAIVGLLDDPLQRERMGRAARQRVETVLAWPIQARYYVEALTRCMESGATGRQKRDGSRSAASRRPRGEAVAAQ
ncbi:MAG: glycosyltransferase family 4 protein [Acidimicrobiia bacterium]